MADRRIQFFNVESETDLDRIKTKELGILEAAEKIKRPNGGSLIREIMMII